MVLLGADKAGVVAVDHPGGGRQPSPQAKGQGAHGGAVHAQARRRLGVAPAGGQGPAEPAVAKGQEDVGAQGQQAGEAEKRGPVAGKGAQKRQGQTGVGHVAGRTAGDAFQGQHEVGENQGHAQGGHGQEAFAQAFHGAAEHGGQKARAQHHGRDDKQGRLGEAVVEQHRAVGPQAGEGGLGQGDLAAKAQAEIERQDVDRQKQVLVDGQELKAGRDQADHGQGGEKQAKGEISGHGHGVRGVRRALAARPRGGW